MIERLFVKSLLSFERVDLDFASGLVVFSGPSGAGKSVLMGSILAGFGLSDGLAQLSEMEIVRPEGLESDLYELEATPVIKLIKKNSVRCYIDGQSIPRKGLKELFAPYVRYLSVRDRGGFESERLIELIDHALSASDSDFVSLLEEYQHRYHDYREKIAQLERIRQSERELSERIEFATFEIDKIRTIDPREDEVEELMHTKRQLSRLEKITDAITRAEAIFAAEGAVEELYTLLERDGSYFSDAMNQLRADMESAAQSAEELAETDVEVVLDRLEQLNGLIKRHGSIAETLMYLAEKEKELAGYTHIEEDKSALEVFIAEEEAALKNLAAEMTRLRSRQSRELAAKMADYLSALKLPAVSFLFSETDLGETGADRIDLELAGSTSATLSGGEHHRLRLALMATALGGAEAGQGVVILDEIDANVSGDESIAIAEMIAELSRSYQVFAISHQPHLAAKAKQHILITRDGDHSQAIALDDAGRVQEIARIIGGEGADDEAVAFARKLVGAGI